MIPEPDCEFEVLKNGKLYCKKHRQALMYVYYVDGEHKIMCQTGENEWIEKYNR